MVLKSRTITKRCPVCGFEEKTVEKFNLTTIQEKRMVKTGEKKNIPIITPVHENGKTELVERENEVDVSKEEYVEAVTSEYCPLTSTKLSRSFRNASIRHVVYCPNCGVMLVSDIIQSKKEEMYNEDEIKEAGFGELPIARTQPKIKSGLDL